MVLRDIGIETTMSITRNPYIVRKAMLACISASLMNTLIHNIYQLMDGILLGQFVGPDALSAVYMAIPATTILNGLTGLLAAGASIRTSVALGKCENDKADESYSMSVISVVVVAVLISVLSPLFMEGLIGFVCNNERLYPMVYDYVSLLYHLIPVLLLSMALSSFVSVSGNPRVCTKALIASVVTNCLGDVVFIPFFGLGLRGAALSSALGSAVGALILMRHLGSRLNVLTFRFRAAIRLRVLVKNMERGVPFAVGNLGTPILVLCINTMVLKYLGAEGAFVSSCAMCTMYVCIIVVTCAASAFGNVGSLLWGQDDVWGIHCLLRRCGGISLVVLIIAFMLLALRPDFIALIFGERDVARLASIAHDLRIVAFGLPGVCCTLFMYCVYVVQHRSFLSQLSAMALIIAVVPSFVIIPAVFGAEWFWYVFPVAGTSAFAIIVIASTVIWLRNRDKQFMTLLPRVEDSIQTVNTSLSCSDEGAGTTIGIIGEYLPDDIVNEEWWRIVVSNMMSGGIRYADLLICRQDGVLNINISSNNRNAVDAVGRIANDHQEVNFKYMYGINIVNIKISE